MSAVETGHNSQSVMDQVGPNIIHHVSNSDISHPLYHIPPLFGIDFSVTKHVLMIWLSCLIVSLIVIIPTRIYINSKNKVPSGMSNALEAVVSFIKDSIVKPNIGSKWSDTWTPLILTYFFFILVANGIGLIPIFDFIGASSRFIFGLKYGEDAFVNNLLHGGATATGNFWVTSALSFITFISRRSIT